MRPIRGFTLVELVVTLILVAILAVAVMPRFADRSNFDERGYHDQVKAALQYARKAAIAERRNVCVAIGGGTLTITRGLAFGAGCTVPLVDPSTGAAFSLPTPSGVALASSAASFTFDANGRTPVGVAVTVGTLPAVTVAGETGYVR